MEILSPNVELGRMKTVNPISPLSHFKEAAQDKIKAVGRLFDRIRDAVRQNFEEFERHAEASGQFSRRKGNLEFDKAVNQDAEKFKAFKIALAQLKEARRIGGEHALPARIESADGQDLGITTYERI